MWQMALQRGSKREWTRTVAVAGTSTNAEEAQSQRHSIQKLTTDSPNYFSIISTGSETETRASERE